MRGVTPKKTLYMVICRNERQAKDLFERLHAYWKSRCGDRTRLCADSKLLAVYDIFDAVMFVPERQMFNITAVQPCIRARIYNAGYVDKYLDGREKCDA